MIGLDQRMDVYVPDGVTGDWTVITAVAVPCRVVVARGQADAPASERADPNSDGLLLWANNFTMPDNAQIAVERRRYDVQGGTVTGIRDMNSRVAYYRAELVAVA